MSLWSVILHGEEFSVEEIRSAMRTEVMDGDIVPVAMGSNIQAQGVANLLSDIVRFFPSPDSRKCAGINRKTNEIYEADYDFAKAKIRICLQNYGRSVYRKIFFRKSMLRCIKGGRCAHTMQSAEAEAKAWQDSIQCAGNKPARSQRSYLRVISVRSPNLTNTKYR